MAPEPHPADVEQMLDAAASTSPESVPRTGTGGPATPDGLVDLVQGLEGNAALDRPARVLETVANAVAPEGPRRDVLQGSWLGHALHPLLTDLPLGMWMSASLLDLIGGQRARPAATRLVGAGIAAAVPTAATGLAEWLDAEPASRRVGVVHANLNSLALGLYVGSFVARRRGRHGRAVLCGFAGGLSALAGGYLGGHLSIARKVGTRDSRFVDPAPA
jgi:uncharacterized membrane protein